MTFSWVLVGPLSLAKVISATVCLTERKVRPVTGQNYDYEIMSHGAVVGLAFNVLVLPLHCPRYNDADADGSRRFISRNSSDRQWGKALSSMQGLDVLLALKGRSRI